MTIYFIAYGILIFMYCAEKIQHHSDAKKKLTISFFIIFTIMLGFRHPSMGVDLGYGRYYGYLASFEQISKMSWKEVLELNSFLNYEKGYVIYNKVLGLISKDPQILLFVTALISLFLIAATFYKLGDNHNILMIIIIYTALPCFLIQFSGLRQSIAISICVFSLRFIEEKRIKTFLSLILIAACFHTTVLFFVASYFAYWLPIKRKWRMSTLGILVIVFLFRTPLFRIAVRVLGKNTVADQNGAINLFLIFVCIYLFCSLFEKNNEKINGYMNIYFIACVCQAFSGVYSSAIRMGYYFMTALPFLLPQAINNIEDFRQRQIFKFLIHGCFLSFGLYTLSSKGSWAMSNPYHFFWQNIYG